MSGHNNIGLLRSKLEEGRAGDEALMKYYSGNLPLWQVVQAGAIILVEAFLSIQRMDRKLLSVPSF